MPGFKEYQMMFQLSATTSAQFQSAFASAQTSISQLQTKIDALNRLQGDISAYQKQQQAVERTKSKLEMLRQQYDNLKKGMEQSGTASADLQNKMLEKQHQIDKTSASLEQQTDKLNTMETALNEAGVDTNNLAQESQRLQGELGNLRQEQSEVADSAQDMSQSMGDTVSAMESALVASGIIDGLQAIAEKLKECTDASIQYESAMAGVKRTVGGSDTFIEGLGDRFQELSTQIPITSEELAGIATTAGQLGIAQENVESFTTVMAQLATTTDLSADDAATMLAQFANITGTTDYERLGSTIAELGDATATTASKVVQMSQGMAAAASQAGMKETDILAISAAVGSLGIEAQAGSTAMSTLISTLYKAVETGDGLEDFASVAGMTAEEFKTAWGENAVGAMDSFIQGLNDTERNGRSAIVILDELGITNVRQTKAILGLASAGDLLSNTITQSNNAWQQNTALGEKAGVMYGTTESKMTMMQNAANNVKVAIGDALTPAMGSLADAATSILQPIAEFIAQHPALIQGITTIIGVIGGATAALVGLSAVMKVASAVGALLTASIPGLPIILGVTAGIAVLAGGIVALTSAMGDAGQSFEELDSDYDSMIEEIAHQDEISDMCDEYLQLTDQLSDVGDEMQNLSNTGSADIEISATAVPSLQSADFMSPEDVGITLDAEQSAELLKSGFFAPGELSENGDGTVNVNAVQAQELLLSGFFNDGEVTENGDGTISITPEQAKTLTILELFAPGELTEGNNGTVTLTPEQASYLESKGFLSDEGIVSLTPEQAETLTAASFMAAGEDTVTITGEADSNALLSGEDFAGEDMTVPVTPKLSLDEINTQLTQLGQQISATKADLDSAQSTLSTMEGDYDELRLKMLATNESDEKSALRQEMEDLSKDITEQKGKVSSLQTSYDSLNEEYTETQTTATELSNQYARQEELRTALIEQSGGLITATAQETEQFNAQVSALKAISEAKASELRAQAYDNIIAQSAEYAESLRTEAQNQELLNQAAASYNATNELVAGGIDSMKVGLATAYNSLMDLYNSGAEWDSSEVQGYVTQVSDLMYLLTGEKQSFTFWDQVTNSMLKFDAASVSYEHVEAGLLDMAATVSQYEQAVNAADGTQQAFLDNLVSGVTDGGMSLEYLEGLLNEQFAGYENGGQIVADAMAYVREQVEGTTEATEGMAEGVDEVTSSAYDLQTAMDPVMEKLEQLNADYKEAYDSALSSIDGQFDLFEKVNEIEISPQFVNTGEDSMRESLESQAQYMEEYVSMLQQAESLGVNKDLLGELADGSEESAAKLKRIVSESTTPEDIEALNASYELAQQKKEEFATTVAELQTNFTTEMQTIEQQMATSISNMDKSAEATTNAQNTLQALVTQAQSMETPVYNAFKAVADQITKALATAHAPTISPPTVGGYAVGTRSAERGYALVGEEGPELIWFGGGEQVFTADQTEAMTRNIEEEALNANLSSGSGEEGTAYTISFAPQYNISGSADAAEIRTVLYEHDANMRTQLEEMLNEIEADRMRRAYA